MKKILLFAHLLLLLCTKSGAQNLLPHVFEISSDTALVDTLPAGNWQILEDEGGRLTFEEISKSPVAEKFHYDTAKKINFQIATYWFRFELKNTSNHELKIGLYEYLKAKSDWYILSANGQAIHKKTGMEIPWSKNESLKFITYFPSSFNFLPVIIQPQETMVFYNRVVCNYFNYSYTNPKQFFITYGSTEKVIFQNYIENESYGSCL